MRILIVEDNEDFSKPLKKSLELHDYEAVVCDTVEKSRVELSKTRFDVILLDLELPGEGGLSLLKDLRESDDPVPVIIISALTELDDKIQGLEVGADDYLPKPFAFDELLARMRAIMRRMHGGDPLVLKIADLEIDVATRRVVRNEAVLDFTQREFELLQYLARAGGKAVSRDDLAQEVWKASPKASGIYNLIDVHISKLRAKIDDDHELKLIHTVRGVGYALGEEKPERPKSS